MLRVAGGNPPALSDNPALFQTPSILFGFTQFVKRWPNFLELKLKGLYQSLEKEKENFCVLFTYRTP